MGCAWEKKLYLKNATHKTWERDQEERPKHGWIDQTRKDIVMEGEILEEIQETEC